MNKIASHRIYMRSNGTYELEVRFRVPEGLHYQWYTGFESERNAMAYLKYLRSGR